MSKQGISTICFKLEGLASLIRLITLIARESSSFPPPILTHDLQKRSYQYFTYLSLPFGLPESAPPLSFIAESQHHPKSYIRYRSSPSEKVVFQNQKDLPVGEYLSVFPLISSDSQQQDSLLQINNFSPLHLLEMQVSSFQELVRFSLEVAPYPLIFCETLANSSFYFLPHKPIKIGDIIYGRLIYWKGNVEIDKPFLSCNPTTGLISTDGEKNQAISYARLIFLKGTEVYDVMGEG